MANDWFQFKQFLIEQSDTAMKVGTDGVLLGAWAELPAKGSTALDIGTGSGLIALMLAQRFSGLWITGIEIDKPACNQAIENLNNSPWKNRITIMELSLQNFSMKNSAKFDLIVSNPPFFSNSLKPDNKARSNARHQESLNPQELFRSIIKLLNPDEGLFSLIIPFDQKNLFFSIAENYELYPRRVLNIRPVPGKDYKRCMIEFSFTKTKTDEKEMVIEIKRHMYSREYIDLTKEFYLAF